MADDADGESGQIAPTERIDTLEDLMRVVRTEHLDVPVVSGAGRAVADSVVLDRIGEIWRVYVADERSAPWRTTLREFDDEPSALRHVLLKLRQVAAARVAMDALRARRASEPGSGNASPRP